MLNIDEIQNGIVIDHIKAGTAIGLMDLLGIKGNRTSSVALIQNARSHKAESGRKDIIKVEGDASWLNLDVLAYLDPDISVTVIENGKAVKKEKPQPPLHLLHRGRVRPDLRAELQRQVSLHLLRAGAAGQAGIIGINDKSRLSFVE